MEMIVAVDKNWGIGKNNSMLVSIPADLKTFRNMTMGHVVVMGRKTLESLPNGRPLELRKNIVITRNPDYEAKGATILHSLEDLREELKEETRKIFIIGGGTIYEQMLPYCDTVHVTKIDHAYEADTYFPNLDAMDEFEVTAESDEQTYFDLEYTFVRYERKK